MAQDDKGKHAAPDPAKGDGQVPPGTSIDPKEPKPDGKHGR
jgi:hypothetical protein